MIGPHILSLPYTIRGSDVYHKIETNNFSSTALLMDLHSVLLTLPKGVHDWGKGDSIV